MRRAVLDMVYEFAQVDERVIFIGSDLGAGTLQRFREEMPDRFFMEGVSEANVVGIAAGLASEGRIVYVNTLSVFLTRRAYEQVALDVCMHNLNVRLIGNGGGLVYAPLGPTHTAIEDISLMRGLPNMAVVAPADEPEMRRLMMLIRDHQGPVYIRLGKGNEPDITGESSVEKLGEPLLFRDGSDILLITTGTTLHAVGEAAALIQSGGISPAILHLPVLKPVDEEMAAKTVGRFACVVTVEEHVPHGGLGSLIADVMLDRELADGRRLRRMSLPDEFPDRYGSQADLWRYYDLTATAIADTAKRLWETVRG